MGSGLSVEVMGWNGIWSSRTVVQTSHRSALESDAMGAVTLSALTTATRAEAERIIAKPELGETRA